MRPGEFQRAEAIVRQALALAAEARADYVRSACADDGALRSYVESRLRREASGSSLPLSEPGRVQALRTSALVSSTQAADWVQPEPVPLPEQIGHYRVLSALGEGAMGVVYLAEQESPRRHVALKVLRHSGQGLAQRRFDLEAAALGRLQHPGIAQIYESGMVDTPHGRLLYFAMELVNGKPIVDYVWMHRLDLRLRLQLLARVCDAVQHAHSKGVIHRDLKPGNILVTEDAAARAVAADPGEAWRRTEDGFAAQPKILDFGVARLTDVDVQATRDSTQPGQLVGTVAYMSPEQVAGNIAEIDTRSDIYALGVIGYELVAGRMPYDLHGQSIYEVARTIREAEPLRLRGVSADLRSDVETILGRALEKEKERRYPTAAALADDLRRLLHDEPILARPPSAGYRFRKFARRNRALVAGAAAVLTAILVGLVAFFLMYMRAETLRRAAVAESERASAAEAEALRQRDQAQQAHAVAAASAAKARAVTHFLRRMLTAPDPVAVGPEVKMVDVLRTALADIGPALFGQPEVEADVRLAIGETFGSLGIFDVELRELRRATALLSQTLGPDAPATLEAEIMLAGSLDSNGHYEEAEQRLSHLVQRTEEVLGPEARLTHAALCQWGETLQTLGRHEQAEPVLRDVLARLRRSEPRGGEQTLHALSSLGASLGARDKHAEAEPVLLEMLLISRRSFPPTHPGVISALNNYAQVLNRRGCPELAEPLLRELRSTLTAQFPEGNWQSAIASGHYGRCLQRLGRIDEAEVHLLEFYYGMAATLGVDRFETERAASQIVGFYQQTGRLADSAWFRQDLMHLRLRLAGDNEAESMVNVLREYASALAELGYAAPLEIAVARVLEDIELRRPDDDRRRAHLLNNTGVALCGVGRFDDAERLLLEALDIREPLLGPAHKDTRATLRFLADLETQRGRLDRAEHYRSRAAERP